MLYHNSIFGKIIATTLCLLMVFSASAQKKVTPLPIDSTMKFGKNYFFYALPQTAIRVDVCVNKMSEMKGVYTEYAEKLLGLTNVITQNKVLYGIKNIDIQAVSVPDEEYVYAVELSSVQLKNQFLTKLYERNNTFTQLPSPIYTPSETVIPDFFRYYSDLAYTEESDDYVETQIIDGVVRQVKASKVQKVNKSDAQKAQEAADMIAKIRQDRYDLLTGAQEVTYSKEALELMIDQLNTLEKNYIELFTGFVVNNVEQYTVWIYPQTGKNQSLAFSFSPQTGFSESKSAVESENYYLNYLPQFDPKNQTDFEQKNAFFKGKNQGNGYRIRRALPMELSLTCSGKTVARFGIAHIYQMGKIEILPLNQDAFEIDQFGFIY